MKSLSNLLSLIGRTPLIHLPTLTADLPGIQIYGKAEYFNPGGSVKDRPALSMILDGEATGKLDKTKTLIDATSGNTGIAYAMICAAKGYQAKIVLPSNASHERKRILQAYGAEAVYTDPAEGSDGSTRKVREIVAADPGKYFYPDQYSNPANWQAHFEGTGPEIIEQTKGRITHFIASMGTSGTFVGVTRRLHRDIPNVHCYSAQPATGFHGLEGLRNMSSTMVPAIYDPSLAEENLWLETEDAYKMVKRLARQEGVLVGISAGGNVTAALSVAHRLHAAGQTGVIVTILCDSADKYLSESFWDAE
jgi:cysteine synthase B